MFAARACLAVCVVLCVQVPLPAAKPDRPQKDESSQAIEDTIRQFFTSFSKRDGKGVKAVLDTHFMAIEASGEQGRIDIIDPGDPKGLLPPEGNDDWDHVGVADVKVETSKSYPTIATASFLLVLPLDEQELAQIESALKQHADRLDDRQKKALAQAMEDRAHRMHMFAMLVRQHGNWKIACMTFPK